MRVWLYTSAVLVVALVAASCSKGGPADPTPGSNATTITILGQNGNLSFTPNPADAGGRTVVFKNADSVTHRVVLNDGSIDTGDIAPGATSRSVSMPSSGTNYHCAIHDNMGGAVLPAAGGEPPPCEGVYCY
jgi:plastocyanin